MKKLAQVYIQSIYNIIGKEKILEDNIYHRKRFSYRCECGALYSVVKCYSRMAAICSGYAYSENHTICPVCGREACIAKELQYGTAPLNARISLYELGKEVVLKFKYAVPIWNEKFVPIGTFFEELRLDIEERKGTFIQNGVRHFVGIPLDNFMAENSLMRFITYKSGARESFPILTQLLKMTRDAVERKFKEIHGYKLDSTYVGYDKYSGKLAFPLLNIAYRLIFTDSPNLQKLGASSEAVSELLCLKKYDYRALQKMDTKSPYEWLIRNYHIAQKPFARKILANEPYFFKVLSKVNRLGWSIDYQQNILKLLMHSFQVRCGQVSPQNQRYLGRLNTDEVLDAIISLKRYQARDILQLLKSHDYSYLLDIARMLHDMPRKYQILSRQVNLCDLHDWLTDKQYELAHKDYSLQIPPQRIKELTKKIGDVQFMVPNSSYELKRIGKQLKNCVYTYSKACLTGKCQIVVVVHEDRFVACLEVADGKLVQAKLFANERVYMDSLLNEKVKQWCSITQTAVKTSDVTL